MEQGSSNLDAAAHPGLYRFGDVEVDVAAHTLKRGGQPCAIEPKAFAVLLALLRRPGELLGHDELLDGVWGHRHVTPGVLTRAIAQLRGALGDDPHHPRYIQTRHALGYSFIGELIDGGEAGDASVPEAAEQLPAGSAAHYASGAEAGAPQGRSPVDGEGGHRHHWRFRHWVAASLAALLIAAAAVVFKDRRADAPAIPVEPSIAVLPFTALSDDRRDSLFAEGLSIELLNALAGLPGLKVAAWRPAEAIDRTQDIREIGRILGVATILDASVGRDGNRLRINARLSDAATGYTIWSRRYDRETTRIFDTQSELAREVAESLLGVLPDAGKSLAQRLTPTRNVAAFDAYLLGITYSSRGGQPATVDEAEGQFRKALSEDSRFARAQAQLCRLAAWRFETYRDPGAFDSARVACERAADMDPSIGEVNLARGDLYRVRGEAATAMRFYDSLLTDPALRTEAMVGRAQVLVDRGDEAAAMTQFRLASEASPDDAQVHAELGYQQYRLGRYADAVESYRRAVELRPDVAAYWSIYGGLLIAAGDNTGAETALTRALSIEPGASALSNLGEIRYQAGDYAGAAALFRQAADLNPDKFAYVGYLGDALSASPATADQAREAYVRAAERAQQFVQMKKDDAIALASLAWYRANLGETGEAVRLIEQARKLKFDPGEVALYAAQTYALVGDLDGVRQSLRAAREADVPEKRIATRAALIEFWSVGEGRGPDGSTRSKGSETTAGSTKEEN